MKKKKKKKKLKEKQEEIIKNIKKENEDEIIKLKEELKNLELKNDELIIRLINVGSFTIQLIKSISCSVFVIHLKHFHIGRKIRNCNRFQKPHQKEYYIL